MVAIFFIYLIAQFFIFRKREKIAFIITLVNLVLLLLMLYYHATTTLQIRL